MENQELLLKFKEHLKIKNFSPASIASYLYCLKRFFTYLKDKSLKEVTKQDILEYRVSLKEKHYSPRTLERMLYSLKSFFKYLEENFYLLVNPCATLILPAVPKSIPQVLTEKEVKRILKAPNTSLPTGIRDRALLEVLYSSGLRIGEVHNLTIFDIDLSSGFLRVNKAKFSKDRFVPLTKVACLYLKEYLSKIRPQFTKNRLQEKALFVGRKGKALHKQLISQLVKDYAKSAGIKKKVTVHTFRHTFATHLLDNGVDLFKVQRLLGHTRPESTQLYTQVNPKGIKQEHEKCHPREMLKDEG